MPRGVKGSGSGKGKGKNAAPLPALQVPPEQWAANQVERWALEKLKPHPRNVKKHSDAQVRELVASIAEHGVVKPIVVEEDGTILAGHGTRLALQLMKAAEAPVIVARGWSDESKRRYMLRDNKVAENSAWDKDALGIELADLKKLPGADLGALGFRAAELDRLLPSEEREGLVDPDDLPLARPAEEAAVSRRGDVWLLGSHRLMCGDSTNAEHVGALLGADRPNLMVTDPPYGVSYDPDWQNRVEDLNSGKGPKPPGGSGGRAIGEVANDGRADWREAWALFPGAVAYVWHGALHCAVVAQSLEACRFQLRAQIVWVKVRSVFSRGHYHWQHEPAYYAVREGEQDQWRFAHEHEVLAYAVRESEPGEWHGGRKQSTVWEIEHLKSDTGHGTQKPVECMKRPILNNSKPGDFVYEPFSGSGTTIIAAEITGRRALAMEVTPAYVDVAIRRWEGFTGSRAILANGEREWAAVAEERGVKVAA